MSLAGIEEMRPTKIEITAAGDVERRFIELLPLNARSAAAMDKALAIHAANRSTLAWYERPDEAMTPPEDMQAVPLTAAKLLSCRAWLEGKV